MEHFLTFSEAAEQWKGLIPLWDRLQKSTLPIYLYGMGDGAEKIAACLQKYGIPLKGVFASDEYVRGHSFLGYPVLKLSQVEEIEKDGFIILLAFAAFKEDLVEKIKGIGAKHQLYAPDTPVAGINLFTRQYLADNLTSFEKVFSLLADEKSREVFRDVISFKITGDISYLLRCQSSEEEVTGDLIPLKGRAGTLVDLGAYDGDTVRSWITVSQGEFEHILSLEPDAKNFKRLQKKMEGWDLSRVTFLNAAAHSEKTTLTFALRGGRNSALLGTGGLKAPKTYEVAAESVDGLLQGEKAGLIKMDVEGNEAEALKGSRETIFRWHPPLMISAYHRSEDLIALPLLVEELTEGTYAFYLRHHPYIPAWETNYYAVPKAGK